MLHVYRVPLTGREITLLSFVLISSDLSTENLSRKNLTKTEIGCLGLITFQISSTSFLAMIKAADMHIVFCGLPGLCYS